MTASKAPRDENDWKVFGAMIGAASWPLVISGAIALGLTLVNTAIFSLGLVGGLIGQLLNLRPPKTDLGTRFYPIDSQQKARSSWLEGISRLVHSVYWMPERFAFAVAAVLTPKNVFFYAEGRNAYFPLFVANGLTFFIGAAALLAGLETEFAYVGPVLPWLLHIAFLCQLIINVVSARYFESQILASLWPVSLTAISGTALFLIAIGMMSLDFERRLLTGDAEVTVLGVMQHVTRVLERVSFNEIWKSVQALAAYTQGKRVAADDLVRAYFIGLSGLYAVSIGRFAAHIVSGNRNTVSLSEMTKAVMSAGDFEAGRRLVERMPVSQQQSFYRAGIAFKEGDGAGFVRHAGQYIMQTQPEDYYDAPKLALASASCYILHIFGFRTRLAPEIEAALAEKLIDERYLMIVGLHNGLAKLSNQTEQETARLVQPVTPAWTTPSGQTVTRLPVAELERQRGAVLESNAAAEALEAIEAATSLEALASSLYLLLRVYEVAWPDGAAANLPVIKRNAARLLNAGLLKAAEEPGFCHAILCFIYANSAGRLLYGNDWDRKLSGELLEEWRALKARATP